MPAIKLFYWRRHATVHADRARPPLPVLSGRLRTKAPSSFARSDAGPREPLAISFPFPASRACLVELPGQNFCLRPARQSISPPPLTNGCSHLFLPASFWLLTPVPLCALLILIVLFAVPFAASSLPTSCACPPINSLANAPFASKSLVVQTLSGALFTVIP